MTRAAINIKPRSLLSPFIFLFGLSLIGLNFPVLGYVICSFKLIDSYKRNKYDFLIELTFLVGVYGFYNYETDFPFKFYDIIILICPILSIKYAFKDPVIKKVTVFSFLFFFCIVIFALSSEEKFWIQFRNFRQYLCIFYFVVPLVLFNKKKFDIDLFFYRIILFFAVICLMYIFDGLILHENFFIPKVNGATSTWFELNFSFGPKIKRIYPAAFYILGIVLYTRNRFTFSRNYLLIFLLGVVTTLTFSLLLAIALTLIMFSLRSSGVKMILMVFLFFSLGIFIENNFGVNLRLNQILEQFESLDKSSDYSALGTGRGAQFIPNYEMLVKNDKLWTGVGHLHKDLSTDSKFMVQSYFKKNEYSVMGQVEITQLATLIAIGIIGLVLQHAYFIGMAFALPVNGRRLYIEAILFFSIMGIGGFGGFNYFYSLLIIGLTIGVVILNNDRSNVNIKL